MQGGRHARRQKRATAWDSDITEQTQMHPLCRRDSRLDLLTCLFSVGRKSQSVERNEGVRHSSVLAACVNI